MTASGEWNDSAIIARGATKAAAFARSPGLKFFLTGALTLMLAIPLWIVLALTSDRENRRAEVTWSVAREWGSEQRIYGPMLVVPFHVRNVGGEAASADSLLRYAAILPETFDVVATSEVEERSVSIYTVPAFSSQVAIKGRFGAVDQRVFGSDVETIDWDRAFIAAGISDLTGVEDAALRANGGEIAFEPGLLADPALQTTNESGQPIEGIHAPLTGVTPSAGFDFTLDLRVRGTGSLMIAPVGRQSDVRMTSNWQHPNFTVGMLPSERTIGESGFGAVWRVPYLTRTTPQSWIIDRSGPVRFGGQFLGAGFVSPVDFYALVTRALKYGLMFIGITFLTVFMLEALSPQRIHLVQYCLVGLVLVMFFVLLLALSERIGFGPAYLVASTATGLVVSAFIGSALESRTKAIISAASFTLTFALLYAILRLEDLALLGGSIVGFVILSAVLFATRRIDWSGVGRTASTTPALETGHS